MHDDSQNPSFEELWRTAGGKLNAFNFLTASFFVTKLVLTGLVWVLSGKVAEDSLTNMGKLSMEIMPSFLNAEIRARFEPMRVHMQSLNRSYHVEKWDLKDWGVMQKFHEHATPFMLEYFHDINC